MISKDKYKAVPTRMLGHKVPQVLASIAKRADSRRIQMTIYPVPEENNLVVIFRPENASNHIDILMDIGYD
jgi:hypothetical protein